MLENTLIPDPIFFLFQPNTISSFDHILSDMVSTYFDSQIVFLWIQAALYVSLFKR